jgi:microcystin-dependent protein
MKQLEELANIFSDLAKELKKVSIPIGAVQAYATKEAPNGWMKCDGTELRIEEYPDLYNAIGDTFNNVNTPEGFFCLPDLQGQFVRGWDEDGNVDAQRDFGTLQEDAFQGHKHTFAIDELVINQAGEHKHNLYAKKEDKSSGAFTKETMLKYTTDGNKEDTTTEGKHNHALSCKNNPIGNAQTSTFDNIRESTETRPKNIALLYCIKVK